jgi:rhodanese-related sulfurtransferase/DNA-binding transcriptional ArsR family regulator
VSREEKTALYEQFARIGKALAHPARLELLDLLAQGERSVEALAAGTGMRTGNTSAQLQQLRAARLVTTRKDGTRVYYRLVDDDVAAFTTALKTLAHHRLAEVDAAAGAYLGDRDSMTPVTRTQLAARLNDGETSVLDVRPSPEYAAGHIPGAYSIPLDELTDRIPELPQDTEVVAYCRGPYCVLAPDAVRLLVQAGYRAHPLEDGLPEWRLAGYPIDTSPAA